MRIKVMSTPASPCPPESPMPRIYDPTHPINPGPPNLLNRIRCLVHDHLDYLDYYEEGAGTVHLICVRCSGTKTTTYPKANVIGDDSVNQY